MSSGEEGEEPDKRRARYQQAAAAGAGAGVGAIMGSGPVGAMVGAALGPLLVPLAEKVWAEVTADGKRRAAEALALACEALDYEPEELEGLIGASDRTRLLAGIALSAATRTAWQDKVRTLGRSLASGLLAADDAQIDTEQLIIAAIADIEAPQLSLLELLACWVPPGQGRVVAEPYEADPSLEEWHLGGRRWTAEDIGVARPRLRPVMSSLLGTLQRHGLATQNDNIAQALENYSQAFDSRQGRRIPQATPRISGATVTPAATWSPTELGEQVLDRFCKAGAEVPDGWISSPTE